MHQVTILSNTELTVLWGIALLLPPVAHLMAILLGRAVGLPSNRALPRVAILMSATVITLVWLTGSRFAEVEASGGDIRIGYAFPPNRSVELQRKDIQDVWLAEARFPRSSYTVGIEVADGRVYRSVGVTEQGLVPLYDIFEIFHPGETPFIASR